MGIIRNLAFVVVWILGGCTLGLILGLNFGPLVVPFVFRLFSKESHDPGIEGAFWGGCAGILIGGLRSLKAITTTRNASSHPSPSGSPTGAEMPKASRGNEISGSNPLGR